MDSKIMKPIRRLLIANRGEIACRIIRTAKKLNIHTIAIYAIEDQHAQHTTMADEAYAIGHGSLANTYLDMNQIIAIAKSSGADAIHPGYGFLSENADFANRCQQAQLIFIGPPATAIAKMAVKDVAKRLMREANVPVVPGYEGEDQSVNALQQAAKQIGYPILLKAAKGGGGKGMRMVKEAADLPAAIQSAKRESLSSFGDDTLFVEKYLQEARHIEVQIFRDNHGHTVHLFERDCSLQRRHQKIIEESPALGLKPAIREQLYLAAIKAADAIDYLGAGTVEFLYAPNDEFYFMEMNTRLQVEHPVTEMITGIDLVEWQIHIAEGKPIPLGQTEIKSQGHAIEARIYAEDPNQGFLPATGTIKAIFQASNPDYRLDSALQVGEHVGIHFDPMLAKLIVHADTRGQAIDKLDAALSQFQLVGITNNIAFLRHILQNSSFQQSPLHTQSLEQQLPNFLAPAEAMTIEALTVASLLFVLSRELSAVRNADRFSPWSEQQAWRLNTPANEAVTFYSPNEAYHVNITHLPTTTENHRSIQVLWQKNQQFMQIAGNIQQEKLQVELANQQMTLPCYYDNTMLAFIYAEKYYTLKLADKSFEHFGTEDNLLNTVRAPMPGVLTQIWVKSGDKVAIGEKLLALEAMKMEHTLTAINAATIKTVRYNIGDQVEEGCELVDFE